MPAGVAFLVVLGMGPMVTGGLISFRGHRPFLGTLTMVMGVAVALVALLATTRVTGEDDNRPYAPTAVSPVESR